MKYENNVVQLRLFLVTHLQNHMRQFSDKIHISYSDIVRDTEMGTHSSPRVLILDF